MMKIFSVRVHASVECEQFTESLRQVANDKQMQCYELLLAVREELNDLEVLGLSLYTDAAKHFCGFAVLFPCQIVTQWASRYNLLLLQPIFAADTETYRTLLQKSCDYVQNNLAKENEELLALLVFSKTKLDGLHDSYPFCPAWNYVITVSFPIAEEAVWLLPLQEAKLQCCGGEVELPRQFGNLWNCVPQMQ